MAGCLNYKEGVFRKRFKIEGWSIRCLKDVLGEETLNLVTFLETELAVIRQHFYVKIGSVAD